MKSCDCCGNEYPDDTYFYKDEDSVEGGDGICPSCQLDDCGAFFDRDMGFGDQ